jgi:hypothetical protein
MFGGDGNAKDKSLTQSRRAREIQSFIVLPLLLLLRYFRAAAANLYFP